MSELPKGMEGPSGAIAKQLQALKTKGLNTPITNPYTQRILNQLLRESR